jgi:excisionase family DNA binding protein
MSETPQLLTVREVARRTRQSIPTVYRQIKAGQLDAYRIGVNGPLRVPAHAVDELLQPARRIAA